MSTGVPSPPASFLPAQQENVIDLTEDRDEQNTPNATNSSRRGPRFDREIMTDVVDLEAPQTPTLNRQASSPEVQFLGSARREQPQPQQTRFQDSSSPFLTLFRPDFGRPASRSAQLRAQAFQQEVALRTRDIFGAFRNAMGPFWIGDPPREGVDLTVDFEGPFGYTQTGARPARAAPVYQAPPPAAQGFTRSAGEEEIVVCPNCDHELGTGDDPIARQIWLSRACGHVCASSIYFSVMFANSCLQVYCGVCTKNRALSRKKQDLNNPPKTKPFAKCVVPDCGKSVSQPKTMIQIYL